MTRLRIVLVLLALAAVVWLLWSEFAAQAPDPASDDAVAPAEKRENAASGAPKPPTLESRPPVETPPPEASPPVGEAEPRDVKPRRRIVLRLLGYDAGLPGVAKVRLEGKIRYYDVAGSTGVLPGTIFREGDAAALTFDLTDEITNRQALTLRIHVDHPGYLAGTGVLELPPLSDASRGPPPAVDIRMRRAFSLLIRVHDPDGKPLESMGVAVHRVGPEGHVVDPKKRYVSSAVDEIRGGGQERWRLRVPEPGRYIVTAAARGRLHATRRIRVSEPETELAPFVLLAGAVITGRVAVAGMVPTGCTVAAHPLEAGFEFQVAGRTARRVRGALLPGSAVANVRADGTFRLVGLGAEEYRVHVQSIGSPTTTAALYDTASRVVRAPADDIELVVTGARIRVQVQDPEGEPWRGNPLLVRDDGKPLPADIESTLAGRAFVQGETNDTGIAEFAVPADTAWLVLIEEEDTRHAPARVRAPAAGTATDVRIALEVERDPDAIELTVNLQRSDGGKVELVELELARLGANGPDGTSISTFWLNRRTGSLWVPPGRWRLRVAPTQEEGASLTLLLATERELELIPAKPHAVTVTLERGGLLRLSALDPKGGFVPAGCTVRDAEGRTQDLRFSHFGARFTMRNDTRLGGESASTTTTALPAGTYSVVLAHDDYRQAKREVEVRAGKTTTLEVRLEPR